MAIKPINKDALTLVVPPGIGDVSWIYSKVQQLATQRKIVFRLCGDHPFRGKEFVDVLPNIVNQGYGNVAYEQIRDKLVPTRMDLSALPNGSIYNLSLNPHLEGGNQLATAFPEQSTNYHYTMKLPPVTAGSPVFKLQQYDKKRRKIGFYCSSYAHRADIVFWKVPGWIKLLKMVLEKYPDALLVALGAPYDDRTKEVVKALVDENIDVISFFGQHIGETLNVMKQFDYFFSFPSGLGILSDVINIPCMMWFWGNLPGWERVKGLPGSYADPENVKSFRHITAPYASVDASFQLFMDKGAQHVRKV